MHRALRLLENSGAIARRIANRQIAESDIVVVVFQR